MNCEHIIKELMFIPSRRNICILCGQIWDFNNKKWMEKEMSKEEMREAKEVFNKIKREPIVGEKNNTMVLSDPENLSGVILYNVKEK